MGKTDRSDKRITIPATIEAAEEQLGGLGDLLTAKEWERAAIVYAFTHRGHRNLEPGNPDSRTFKEFAALGITGLRNAETVSTYRKAWQTAIDEGKAKPVKPGDRPATPDMEWPPTGHPRSSKDSESDEWDKADAKTRQKVVGSYLGSATVPGEFKARAIAEALHDDYVAECVAESIGSNPKLIARYEKAKTRTQPTTAKSGGKRKPLNPDDWENWTAAEQEEFDKKTVQAARHIQTALFLRRQGYVASGEAEMLLALIDKSDIIDDLEAHANSGGSA